ncbi:Phage-related protein [Nonomuraea maritima]|uniref:Phage-related protein n=1 Tax=Nonomuraea maritima TaxID=683260 RepID=A0A1G9PIA9_9ACTN|nr:type II toxin-antitoxin system RelE/ParE family toxin [Nonomuraea maritima]SDL98538.1 Phage-related protein [Nonomuraea maritima]
MEDRSKAKWQLYTTPSGAEVVSKEIHEVLQGKPPLLELGHLMQRIEDGNVLDRDVKHLGRGLKEARLSYAGNEYRLYYTVLTDGEHLLLGLKFHKKGGGAQKRAIDAARDRLAEWRSRI